VSFQDLLILGVIVHLEDPYATKLSQGIVSIAGKAHQVTLQGVHELYELDESPQVWGEEPRVNHLVFIRRNLDKEILQEQFISTVLKVGDRN
uniref:CobW C-terminal domain-containing protein n=1 Tax=Oncorhynchus kisutch TaxID=8019 RepID=A0A8C7MF56_ONCKI